jgi:hypothetical protein
MAFGQSAGPPASARQVQALLALLQDAGHRDFRDARGPMGFTQRQAAGKFTRDEADALIAQLEAHQHTGDAPGTATPRAPRRTAVALNLERVPAETLAAELQRRGWIVCEP